MSGEYIFPLNPAKVSWDTKMKQEWDVTTFKSAGQVRKALVQQEYPRWIIEISFPYLKKCEANALLAFYAQCKGQWRPFFYKDAERYKVTDKTLQKGSDAKYQAVIPYSGYEEPAKLIDNVVMYVDGEESDAFSVNGGKIMVTTTGTEIKFDYEYYYKCVFANSISVKQKFFNFYTVSLQLEVVQ